MSWKIMRSETDKCACGEGTITFVVEMDDWNRTRNHRQIHCVVCRGKERQKQQAELAKAANLDALYSKALDIAVDRYLERWLSRYSGLKDAWKLYINAAGDPALGTFYKHVQHHGSVAEYMRWCFLNNFEGALRALAVTDADIQALLDERSQQSN